MVPGWTSCCWQQTLEFRGEIGSTGHALLASVWTQHIVHVNYQSNAERSQHLHGWLEYLCEYSRCYTQAERETVELVDFPLQFEEEHQKSLPPTPHLSSEDLAALEEEIQSLLQKQAVCQIPPLVKGFYSNMFIVPKKDGGQRPVINLKYLNKNVKLENFKMEGLHIIKALLRRDDFMAKMDLKDAFFKVSIAPQSKHLGSRYEGNVIALCQSELPMCPG